jgi:hypothetical protein
MIRVAAAAATVLAITSPARAEIVREMTPAQIEQAIKAGLAGWPACYELKFGSVLAMKPTVYVGCMTTPFSRVAGAARAAKKGYKPFGPDSVPPEMIAPVLEVFAFSQKEKGRGNKRIDVTAVVVGQKEAKIGEGEIVQPTEANATKDEYQNAFGAEYIGFGMRAVFPLEVVAPDRELRVVFDDKMCAYGGFNSLKDECRLPFKLDKLR